MRGFLAAAILLLATPCAAQLRIAEPPVDRGGVGVLEVALSEAEITAGDRLEARLTLVWTGATPATPPRFPSWQKNWGQAEVLSDGEIEAFSDRSTRRVYRQTVVLTAFTIGEIRLPRVSVVVPLGAETVEISHDDELRFEVLSVLPEGTAEPEPRPAAPPRALADGTSFAWTAGALGGAGLLMVWLLARRLGKNVATDSPAPPVAEPLAELLERLYELDPSAAEPAHTGLSLAFRHYLGRSLDFPAAESTTREIRHRLRATRVEPALAGDAVRLLLDCDQVKFAQVPVHGAATRGRLVAARDLAREIDRRLAPPEPPAEELAEIDE